MTVKKKKTTVKPSVTTKANQVVIPKVSLPRSKSAVNGNNGDNGNGNGNGNGEIYEIMERKDEQQIVAELQGRYLDEFVYEFEMEGKKITGLSWLGVQEASRALGGIDIEIMERKEGEAKTENLDWKWIEFVIKAKDVNTDSARLGIKRQYNKGRRKDGKIYDIPFYTEIALSKAQRNAIRSLLPQTLIKAWIQTHRKGATEKDIQAGQRVIQETRAQIARYNCTECNGAITPAVADYSIRNYGKEMCMNCQSSVRAQLN